MAKFFYSPIPATVLCNPDLPPLMKLRYGILLGAAFNRQILKKSLDQIAELWAEAEGEPIDTDSAGIYLGKMASAGLIRREQVNRYTWVTHLLHRYDKRRHTPTNTQPADNQHTATHTQSTASQQIPTETCETPTPCKGLDPEPPTPRKALTPESGAYLISVVVDGSQDLDLQQQHLVEHLVSFGILQETAIDLALRGVGLADAVMWCEYARRSKSLRNPAGFVVAKLGKRDEPPDIAFFTCPLCHESSCQCGFLETSHST